MCKCTPPAEAINFKMYNQMTTTRCLADLLLEAVLHLNVLNFITSRNIITKNNKSIPVKEISINWLKRKLTLMEF